MCPEICRTPPNLKSEVSCTPNSEVSRLELETRPRTEPFRIHNLRGLSYNPINYGKLTGCMPCKVEEAIVHGGNLHVTPV